MAPTNTGRPPPVAPVDVLVRLQDVDAVHRLLSQPLDFGCRPVVIPRPDGSFEVPALVSPEQLAALRSEGLTVDERPPAPAPAEVGEGDRFGRGSQPVRGFATKTPGRAGDRR